MIVIIKNQKINLKASDLPIVVEHGDKTYFIKFSKKKNGIYLNRKEPNDEKTI